MSSTSSSQPPPPVSFSGRGVVNYSTSSKPSHALSGKTTEFDDALLQRNIVTAEQVYLAQGASTDDAQRLAHERQERIQLQLHGEQEQQQQHHWTDQKDNDDPEEDDDNSLDDDDDDDDEFLQRYRQARMAELKQQQKQQNQQQSSQGIIRHIARDEWTTAVNEASQTQWILVVLVNDYCRDRVQQELHHFQRQQKQQSSPSSSVDNTTTTTATSSIIITPVIIAATDAIPNWPIERVPALFAYHHGLKQHEWIATVAGEWPASLPRLLHEEWGMMN